MSHHSIKAGDIVELKTGGPDLTVTFVDGDVIYVAWHGGDEVACLHQASLPSCAFKRLTLSAPSSRLAQDLDDEIPF